jgi:hypothetical protein
MNLRYIILLLTLFINQRTNAQIYKFKLINQNDSAAISFASIKIEYINNDIKTNESGEFDLYIEKEFKTINLEIKHINCNKNITIPLLNEKLNVIYVDCPTINLNNVSLKFLSEKEILKKAIQLISTNYIDHDYAINSFYRQYQNRNGTFKNLVESKGVTLFKLKQKSNLIVSEEYFAAKELRRSEYAPTEYTGLDDYSDFMEQNPIYHLKNSMFEERFIDSYTLSMDSLKDDEKYIINYSCKKFTNENHGISNYHSAKLDKEGFETGKFVIDKNTFAFIEIERNAFRNTNYNYPLNNNFLVPDRKFTVEFIEGHLKINYELHQGKWFLKSMFHSYSNNFYRTQTYKHAYTTTDFFELYSDIPTQYIDSTLKDSFFREPHFMDVTNQYKSDTWEKDLPFFYFAVKEKVFADLEAKKSLVK